MNSHELSSLIFLFGKKKKKKKKKIMYMYFKTGSATILNGGLRVNTQINLEARLLLDNQIGFSFGALCLSFSDIRSL